MLAAVSTQNKLLLGGMAAIFIAFALVSALWIPRSRPEFPGRRRNAFLAVTGVLFVAMLLAVELFAVEEEEAHAETTEQAAEGGGETEPAATTPGEMVNVVRVVATEFELEPDRTDLEPGTYEFELVNQGEAGHNLVVRGPDVDDEATPVIDAGQEATLTVELAEGDYELYCSVPGHEDAGMVAEITVGS